MTYLTSRPLLGNHSGNSSICWPAMLALPPGTCLGPSPHFHSMPSIHAFNKHLVTAGEVPSTAPSTESASLTKQQNSLLSPQGTHLERRTTNKSIRKRHTSPEGGQDKSYRKKRSRKCLRPQALKQQNSKLGVQGTLPQGLTSRQRSEQVREGVCSSEFACGWGQRAWTLRALC